MNRTRRGQKFSQKGSKTRQRANGAPIPDKVLRVKNGGPKGGGLRRPKWMLT